MAWDASTTVTIGNYTRAKDHNALSGNAVWLQANADVDHDFDTTTGTGFHNCAEGASNEPLHLSGNGFNVVLGLWQAADGSKWLLGKSGSAAFDRADADFAIPMNSVDDAGVPAS